jgi:hypothetical protein
MISFSLLANSHWRRRHRIPPKRWYLSIKLHDISSQYNAFLILAVRTTNLKYWISFTLLLSLFLHILRSRMPAQSSNDLQNFICEPLPLLSEGCDRASNLPFSYFGNSGFKSARNRLCWHNHYFWDIMPCSPLKVKLTFLRNMSLPSSGLKNKSSKIPSWSS